MLRLVGGEQIIDVEKAAEAGEVNLANALDLSESEEEEEMEDLVEDFAMRAEMEQVCIYVVREECLF